MFDTLKTLFAGKEELLPQPGFDGPDTRLAEAALMFHVIIADGVVDEAEKFKTVFVDSLSEVAEVVLGHEKSINKDGRAAYGEMATQMTALIRAFRDLPGKHVVMTAKAEKSQDEAGRMLYAPSMPGAKMGQALPYFFDLVLALRVEKDAEGIKQRALMCDGDGLWSAKDRSGKLDGWEAPDLGAVFSKIMGGGK